MQNLLVFQYAEASGWFVAKIRKLCLNLSKLCLKYRGLFFSRTRRRYKLCSFEGPRRTVWEHVMLVAGSSTDIDVDGAFSGEDGTVVRNWQQAAASWANTIQQVVQLPNWHCLIQTDNNLLTTEYYSKDWLLRLIDICCPTAVSNCRTSNKR